MKNAPLWPLMVWLVVTSVSPGALGAPFTYQGRLLDGGQPANGAYDLQFALSGVPVGESYIGSPVTAAPVAVSNGLFTVALDFGDGVFDGSARWLEVGVRTNGSAAPYTVLTPRQPLTAAPYALYANTAGVASGGSGTNTTVYGGLSLAGMTNVVLYATNQAVVTTPPNTNVVVIDGAGIAAANGTYTLQSTAPNLVYANAGGMRLAYMPGDLDYVWQIINPTGTVLYGESVDDLRNVNFWQAIGATGPKPSAVSYGVSVVTNFLTQLAVTGARVPGPSLGNELYVNGEIGNDLFARRPPGPAVQDGLCGIGGRHRERYGASCARDLQRNPFQPDAAARSEVDWRRQARDLHLPATGQTASGNLNLSSSNVLSSFSTDFVISLGGYWAYPAYGGATNTLLENIEAYGIGDVVYGSWWQAFRAVNCDLNSQSDCFADGQNGTRGPMRWRNCIVADCSRIAWAALTPRITA